ncbi:MAG: hypothetical protein SF162_11965 [bacterium]|nr:hypothetical protein [bacterium]
MRLDEFEWSRNPRGLHVYSIYQTPLEIERYSRPRMGWAKLMAVGTEYVDDAINLLARGITPIVRLYLGRWGAAPANRALNDLVIAFRSAGVRWFEFYNEPNLDVEWPTGFDPTWQDRENVIRPLMENWLSWAEFVISVGGYPGFISLAESDNPRYAAVAWMDAFLNYLAENQYERFRAVLGGGMYCATHPYILNHFYQEIPGRGPTSARPPDQQRAREPGWHFEYPYDPISQRDDPGRTVYGGTARTPYGDPVGLIAMGQMFNERCSAIWGSQAVPVVGTEGGIFPFRDGVFQQDRRYPPYNGDSQAEATVAMFDWIATQAPPWFFGVTLWKEDDYYVPTNARAIDRLSETEPILKLVPSIEVMAPAPLPSPTPQPTGPGPIHGQADFHMIILGPGLESRWFFETAQAYWNTFRPIVTTLPELINTLLPSQSLGATVIAPPDTVDVVRQTIQQAYPNVYFDLVVADDLDRVRTIFNERARTNRRFG